MKPAPPVTSTSVSRVGHVARASAGPATAAVDSRRVRAPRLQRVRGRARGGLAHVNVARARVPPFGGPRAQLVVAEAAGRARRRSWPAPRVDEERRVAGDLRQRGGVEVRTGTPAANASSTGKPNPS